MKWWCLPVRVETGLALDEVIRFAGTSRLFIDEDESWLRALIRVALPRPLDGLRELRASAPKRSPNRLIISLPADGDGLARRLLDGCEHCPYTDCCSDCWWSEESIAAEDRAGDGELPLWRTILRELHMERLERGDMEGLDGIPLRRTKGEVTAKNKNNIAIISHFFLLTKKKNKQNGNVSMLPLAGVGERQEVPGAGGNPVILSEAFLVST